ncbi:alpha-glucosidase [Parvularcula dongshanensis]|uniref:Alpha-glucosidase n=1 Tax=Parvularcula dongshanensis TaxID=1173995 RepID=A0A840I5G8_9PROT|nr:alpha-glucosidase [Parvularcula dongshanensis]MBB4659521.1 alpha-glucosidase [Parvularcula dongshanensis]
MSEWWKDAVFYQVYPRSFLDTDGDGVGDLEGIRRKLPYVASLGVGAIWLSPVFPSPMADFGYDVSDYTGIDPMFGDLAGFDRLLEEAHGRGLKLIIDQVYSHSSDRHPWFQESRKDRTNPKADWYVWADPAPDGGPPNNWLSVFGGAAWSWDSRRRQYYLHNFLEEQPDLNFHEPAVREAILNVARFWLDRGVDGFRLDVANFYVHDAQLRDNPVAEGHSGDRPYNFQRHLYDRSRPETLQFLAKLRALTDEHQGRMMVAEVFSADPIVRMTQYTEGAARLHTAYSFSFLHANALTPSLIRRSLEAWTSQDAWPSWSFSNHDVARVLTRWGGPETPARAKLLLALLLCLRGTPFLYQGEELGLPQAEVPFERLRDPEAIRFWPEGLGRDGCRTPMPWRTSADAGFSAAEPWLPIDPRHLPLSVEAQEADPDSTLAFTRRFLALRQANRALRRGTIAFRDSAEPLLIFERSEAGERILCLFNLGQTEGTYTDRALCDAETLAMDHGGLLEDGSARLPPGSVLIVRL